MALLDLASGGFANLNEADTFHYGQNDKQWRIKVFSLKFLKGSGCSFLLKLINWVQLFLTLLLVIIVVGLIFWDIYFVLDFRSNFFLIGFKRRKMLELHFFFFNCYCDERLLVSKKVTLVVGPNVKVLSNVILDQHNVRMEL